MSTKDRLTADAMKLPLRDRVQLAQPAVEETKRRLEQVPKAGPIDIGNIRKQLDK
jgi:hypothetical protein